jgi:hypothetical protein
VLLVEKLATSDICEYDDCFHKNYMHLGKGVQFGLSVPPLRIMVPELNCAKYKFKSEKFYTRKRKEAPFYSSLKHLQGSKVRKLLNDEELTLHQADDATESLMRQVNEIYTANSDNYQHQKMELLSKHRRQQLLMDARQDRDKENLQLRRLTLEKQAYNEVVESDAYTELLNRMKNVEGKIPSLFKHAPVFQKIDTQVCGFINLTSWCSVAK